MEEMLEFWNLSSGSWISCSVLHLIGHVRKNSIFVRKKSMSIGQRRTREANLQIESFLFFRSSHRSARISCSRSQSTTTGPSSVGSLHRRHRGWLGAHDGSDFWRGGVVVGDKRGWTARTRAFKPDSRTAAGQRARTESYSSGMFGGLYSVTGFPLSWKFGGSRKI